MENKKNKISFVIFLIILFIFAVGGYFAMRYLTDDKKTPIENKIFTKKDPDYRIDSEKDYIYYDNATRVIEEYEIDYQDVHINLECARDITNTLNQEETAFRNSIKYVKDVEIPSDTTYEENENGIYSLKYREYASYAYKDYISLVVQDNSFDVINITAPENIKAYTFDKKENKILSENDLLEKYDTTMDKIKDKIKTKLNAEQQTVDDMPLINVDKTLSNLNYALYINKIGKLEINYIVNSTKQNYYDNIVID